MSKYKVLCTIPVVCIAVAITVLSHISAPPMVDMGFEFQDKILHVLAYTCFGIAFSLALFARRPDMPKRRFMLIVVLATALFGLYDELHQSLVPNRQAGIDDWIADCIGGGVSLLFRPVVIWMAGFVKHYVSQSGS